MVVSVVVAMLISPDKAAFTYKYSRGSVWLYPTLVSPIDFPVLKSQEELLMEKERASEKTVPYYVLNTSVPKAQQEKLRTLENDGQVDSDVCEVISNALNKVYGDGVRADSDDDNLFSGMIFVQKDKRARQVPGSEVYDVSSARKYLIYSLNDAFPLLNNDSIYNALNLQAYVVPNLVYDEKKTELFRKDAVDYVSPTKGMVYKGQLIVSEGELVTEEVEQLLDSYKAEYQVSMGQSDNKVASTIGHAMLILVIILALFAVVYFTDPAMLFDLNKVNFVALLAILHLVITVVIAEWNPAFAYAQPCAVFALYLVSFLRDRVAFPLYTVLILPVIVLMDNGVELYFINFMAGVVAIVSFSYLSKGWLQFVNSVFIFVIMTLTFLGFKLTMSGTLLSSDVSTIGFLAIYSVLVVLTYPFTFLFEKLFSFVSSSRLVDLADTSSPLLRELSVTAPGTFQHSLQVANIAAAAAREIGALEKLTRAGAMYHDIGKLRNPSCFVENAAPGVNYHADLSPIDSAQEIIRHVDDGVTIARKNGLPEVLIDFIKTHHGQSQTAYFYNKYCNEGGDPEKKDLFTYHGNLPQTKEQVIVMITDAVEAASRTLPDYSQESINAMVDKIVGQRLSSTQLVQSDITIKEMVTVIEFLKKRLAEIYHARIKYPEREKKEN